MRAVFLFVPIVSASCEQVRPVRRPRRRRDAPPGDGVVHGADSLLAGDEPDAQRGCELVQPV